MKAVIMVFVTAVISFYAGTKYGEVAAVDNKVNQGIDLLKGALDKGG